MRNLPRIFAHGVALLALVANTWARAEETIPMLLCDFAGDGSGYRFESSFNAKDEPDWLTLAANASERAYVKIRPSSGAWDAGAFTRIVVDVENPSDATARIRVRALNPDGTDWGNSAINEGFVRPHARKRFNVYFFRSPDDRAAFPALKPFIGMSGLPGGFQQHWHTIDPADIRAIDVELLPDAGERSLRIRSITATHPVVPRMLRERADAFFPFVDRWGQYRWAAWPEKVDSDAQLTAAARIEHEDLLAHPPRTSWNKWGGWAAGPQLAGGEFFRVEKHEGKWWLVDPAGRLFWSHGANSVGYESAGTTITGRERFFADLPPRIGRFATAWSGDGKGVERFDHLKANLQRQFGDDWAPRSVTLAADRMQSWGLNTIGAWSDDDIVALRRLPYTKIVHPTWPAVMHGMPDVFDPAFEPTVRESVARGVGDAAGDPWCIGFFVDNELAWGMDPLDYIGELLGARGSSHTKAAMVTALRDHMRDIAKLNAILGTEFVAWEDVLRSSRKFKAKQIKELAEPTRGFYAELCSRYFRTCRAAVKAVAPGQLYLGARFNVQNRLLVAAAAEHCDVLSFNRYEHSVASFDPFGFDKPVLVSEFHFGALDAGMLGTGLKPASDRIDRADKYADYVEGALRNGRIVGTHWFAFCPQSITGRGDGENFNTGLFDVCNQPYSEMRDALRATADGMYRVRAGE